MKEKGKEEIEGKEEREAGEMGSIRSNNPSTGTQHLTVLYRREVESQ